MDIDYKDKNVERKLMTIPEVASNQTPANSHTITACASLTIHNDFYARVWHFSISKISPDHDCLSVRNHITGCTMHRKPDDSEYLMFENNIAV